MAYRLGHSALFTPSEIRILFLWRRPVRRATCGHRPPSAAKSCCRDDGSRPRRRCDGVAVDSGRVASRCGDVLRCVEPPAGGCPWYVTGSAPAARRRTREGARTRCGLRRSAPQTAVPAPPEREVAAQQPVGAVRNGAARAPDRRDGPGRAWRSSMDDAVAAAAYERRP